MRKSISLTALVFVLMACTFSFAQHPKVGWSLGYYPGWQQAANPPASINWASVTHIVHFTLFPNNDGTLDTAYCHINDGFCKALVPEAHKHGVKCLICLGGAEVGTRFASGASNANRGKLISNMIAFMTKYGYDGIDIDWEESFDNTLILALYKEMRDSLNKISPALLLTAPVASYYINNCYFIYPYVSQMNTMDYSVTASGYPNEMKPFTDKNVPKSKLGCGIGIGMGVNDSNTAKAIADWAINNGYGGIMEWTISTGALNTQVLKALVPYVPAPPLVAVRPFDNAGYGLERRLYVGRNGQTGATVIRYTVPSAGGSFVNLSLFDVRGALVTKLVYGPRDAGAHTVSLDGSAPWIDAGAYVVKMSTPSMSESTRISIAK
jgi:hypothetical protein